MRQSRGGQGSVGAGTRRPPPHLAHVGPVRRQHGGDDLDLAVGATRRGRAPRAAPRRRSPRRAPRPPLPARHGRHPRAPKQRNGAPPRPPRELLPSWPLALPPPAPPLSTAGTRQNIPYPLPPSPMTPHKPLANPTPPSPTPPSPLPPSDCPRRETGDPSPGGPRLGPGTGGGRGRPSSGGDLSRALRPRGVLDEDRLQEPCYCSNSGAGLLEREPGREAERARQFRPPPPRPSKRREVDRSPSVTHRSSVTFFERNRTKEEIEQNTSYHATTALEKKRWVGLRAFWRARRGLAGARARRV